MVPKEAKVPKAPTKPRKARVSKKTKSASTALSSRLYTAELFDVAKLLLERARNRVCDMPITEICTIQGLYKNKTKTELMVENTTSSEPCKMEPKMERVATVGSTKKPTVSSNIDLIRELEFCELTMALLCAEDAAFNFEFLKYQE